MRYLFVLRPLLLGFLLAALCCGAASGAVPSLDEDDAYLDEVATVVPDPMEHWNRAMFRFNDVLMENVARPAYKGYAYVTPEFMRTGIKNFFHNLGFPARFVNNLLQGRGRAAGVEMSRFILNSTAGIGGLIDVAKHHKPVVPVEDEDLGQTFGAWGVKEGFYIVWPVLGPSSARDTVGRVGDTFLDTVSYVQPWWVALSIDAGKTFNELDDILDLYDDLKRVAVEPYSSMRDAYVQYRRAKIAK
jgi:phospholipid-binding lipoprotein MlaA